MKFIITFTGILLLMGGFSGVSKAQCDAGTKIDQCIPNLPDGFNFLKGYEVVSVEGNSKKVEYSYPFAKDTQYIINICTEGESSNGVTITLYDFSRHELASSKIDGKNVSAIMFNCKTTGIYYISYTFELTTKFCGGSVLGFKK